jgi:TetR/AcrR family transcriptional regulator, transcriptional repressor for nem operon
MRYKRGHKEETRRLLVEAASRLFRRQGLAGVTVKEIMAEAGLTYGGFYAYFRSKDELLVHAMRAGLESTMGRMQMAREASPARPLEVFATYYVSEGHRDHPEIGCLYASLFSELARAKGPLRAQLRKGFERVLTNIMAMMPGENTAEKEARAMVVMAASVGSVVMARTARGSQNSNALLAAVREFVISQAGS